MLKLKFQYFGPLLQIANSLEKTLMLGKIERQKRKRVIEDETAEWHHQFNEHELGQTLGDGEGQGGLACCSPGGHKKPDMTWRLNNNNPTVHITFNLLHTLKKMTTKEIP